MVKARESFGYDYRSNPFLKVLVEKSGLSPAEAASVFAELNGEWQYRVQIIFDIDELSDGERQEFDNTLRAMYGRRGLTKTWYELHGRQLNPEVVEYIERILSQPREGNGVWP